MDKDADKLHCYRAADLHLHFRTCSYISCLECNAQFFGHSAVVKMTLLRVTHQRLKAYGIDDVTKNQNCVRTALNTVTQVRTAICRSIYMYPWTLLLWYIGRVCENVI